MGYWADLFEDLDRPSNALQGYLVGGKREGETRFEGLKRGWNQEENYDFEQLFSEDLAKKGWSERDGAEKVGYIATGALNLLVDPLNLIGGGLFKAGGKGVKAGIEAGANVEKGAMKGSMLSSVPNYIDDFYGPSKATTAKVNEMKKGIWASTLKEATPFQKRMLSPVNEGLQKTPSIASYQLAQKLGGMAKTGVEGTKNIVRNVLDPEARALYRGDKINKGLMTTKALSSKGDSNIEYVHRALYNMHIAEQSGSTGSRELLTQFVSKLGNRGYVPLKEGSYTKQTEGFHSVQKGADGPASVLETDMMENIVGGLWKDGAEVPIAQSNKSRLFLKNDSSPIGGQHFNDMKRYLGKKGGELHVVQKAFDNPAVADMNLKELAEYLGKQEYTRAKVPNKKKFYTKEFWDDLINANREVYTPDIFLDEKSGNVWMNFSMDGSSITEGGVNVLSGFKPSGRMVSVVSDEHNFLEKLIPQKVQDYALPNRVVMMTTPTVGNIKTMSLRASKRTAEPNIKGIRYDTGKKKRVKAIADANPIGNTGYKDVIEQIKNAKAKPAELSYEKGRQLQAYGLGTSGLFAMPNDSSSR